MVDISLRAEAASLATVTSWPFAREIALQQIAQAVVVVDRQDMSFASFNSRPGRG
jgi:hypothetical protein